MVEVDSTSTVESRIKLRYDELPPAERRLADVILEFPGEIAIFMASELANRAGVSKAAATRLFKRLGYRDYNEARLNMRNERLAGSPVHLNRIPQTQKGLNGLLRQHLEAEVASLARTIESLDPSKLSLIINELAVATRIYVLGFRNSHFFGSYFQSELARIRPNVMFLPQPGQTLAESLSDLSAKDLMIVVGLRRRVSVAARVLEVAKTAGTKTLYITDHRYRTARAGRHWELQAHVAGASLFDSYASVTSMMNLLCTAVAERLGDSGRKRLRRIDQIHQRLDELAAD